MANIKMKMNELCNLEEVYALAATGVGIDYTGKEDGKILLLIASEEIGEVTVVAGDGIQGTEDLALTVDASFQQAIVLESGKYMQTKGVNKGKVVLKGAATVSVTAIELP